MSHSMLTRRQALAAGVATGLAGGMGALAQERPRRNLRIAMSGYPPALEPVLFNHTATRRVAPQMFDTLIAFDHGRGMALRPVLAERWERVDAKALKLFLRRGVSFHDGSPFTAEDVAFSLGPDHLLGPGRSGRSIALQTLSTLDRVEVIDPFTVILHARENDALMEQRLAAWGSEIVGKRAFEAAGSWEKWTAAPVGTGPYRLVEQKLDLHVRLAAHDAYWGGRPPFETVEYKIVPELASRVNGLITNQYDIITDASPDQFTDVQNRKELEIVGGAVQNLRFLVVDQTGPLLKDVRIRRALSLAIDRKLFVETLWGDRVPVPNGFQMPSFGQGYIESFPTLAYDPKQARELIAAANYKGEPITYRLLNNYYTNQTAGAQVMVEMWKAVGLNVQIEMLENFSQIQKKPVNAIYDSSSTAIFLDQLGQAWREFGPNGTLPKQVGIWSNEEYFALGTKLQTTVETMERRKLLTRMLEIVDRDDPPVIILHASGQFYGKRKETPWLPGQTLDLDFGPFNGAFARG